MPDFNAIVAHLFPPTATSLQPDLRNLDLYLAILNFRLFFQPAEPVLEPCSVKQGCVFIRAAATWAKSSSLGYALKLYMAPASASSMSCFMSLPTLRVVPSLRKARFP